MADEKDDDSDGETLFTLFACGEQVLVWDADEAFVLRSKHRIVGSLVGSLPRKPNQNLCFSLPLALLREEATLLLDKGLARMVDGSQVVRKPSKQEVEEFEALRDQSVRDQLELFKQDREEKQKELSDLIESGRRRKRRREETSESVPPAKRPSATKEMCTTTARTDGSDDETSMCENAPRYSPADSEVRTCLAQEQVDLSLESESSGFIQEKAVAVQGVSPQKHGSWLIRSESLTEGTAQNTADQKEAREDHSPEPALSAVLFHIPTAIRLESVPQRSIDWKYPHTEEDKLRYRIFSDLWEKGYYLTSGARFGGDYLAYPGDPGRFHSFYIVTVLPRGRKLNALDIISLGRLGSTVKKTAVFCSVDNDDRVRYTSVKWTGIS